MDLQNAIKIIRKYLVIHDQPLKAYQLMEALNIPELDDLKNKSYGMVRHFYSQKEHVKAYDIPVPDCELIEPEECAINPQNRYARYAWFMEDTKDVKSMIDLGCYVGSLVIASSRRGAKAVGVDLTTGSINVAKSRAKKLGKDCNFYVADVTKFDKGTYDAVVSFEVFEHVLDPQQYIDHLASLTNDGAWVYITTPDGAYGNGQGNLDMGWEWQEGNGTRGHLRTFNQKIMRQLLNNYEVARLSKEPDGLLWIKYRRKI